MKLAFVASIRITQRNSRLVAMNYFLFVALLTAVATGLASLAVWLLLKGRTRNIVSTILIAGIAALGATSDIPRSLYFRFFEQEELVANIKTLLLENNLGWAFEDDADLERFVWRVVRESGRNSAKLRENSARLIQEKIRHQHKNLKNSQLNYISKIINDVIFTLQYFIDNAQFENCRTFLTGGYSYPGMDMEVQKTLVASLGEAVQSGARGEKNWKELSELEMSEYYSENIRYLANLGYTDDQIQARSRLQTTDQAEMESNCRISHDILEHMLTEYPPEVAATDYVSAF